MASMLVAELVAALDDFRTKLIEHRTLWSKSLGDPIPTQPVRNIDELEEQSAWLTRRLGALRPYIQRFDNEWIMQHPATGVRWDALDEAVGLSSASQITTANATVSCNRRGGRT